MQYLNKNKIAYLASLALLFSYAEMLLPKVLPFLKFGFANIAVLLALDFNFPSFFVLLLIKAFASSFISGTLFSPFFLISLGQSVFSGFTMYFLWKIKGKWLSITGISLAGGAVSCITQIFFASLYLGKGIYSIFPPMLIFSIAASLLTAFFSQTITIPSRTPELIQSENYEKNADENKINTVENIHSAVLIFSVLISSILIFMNENLIFSGICLLLCFAAQIYSGRKVMILPHFFMWIFIILTSIFVPQGKILFSIGKLTVTQTALIKALNKAFKLSSVMALSQCCTKLNLKQFQLLSLTIAYFNALVELFKNTRGNIFTRISKTLNAAEITEIKKENKIKILFPVIILIFNIISQLVQL